MVRVTFDDDLSVFLKASASQDVQTEVAVADRARCAGLPVVEVLAAGTDDGLPGGSWMVTRAAAGTSLERVGPGAATTGRTLDDLAEHYSRLHQVTLPGFGPLAPGGRAAVLDSWSHWQQDTVERALEVLLRRGAVSCAFVLTARRLCSSFAADLDQAPAALLHADLGDTEVFVDPADGRVTAILDWGGALVGDPLYDLARFVGGGPADDPRPARLHPALHARYFELNPQDPRHRRRMLTFYRFHICVVEAAWEEAWAPGHSRWAAELMAELVPLPS